MSLTTDRSDPELGHGGNEEPVPQNKKYLVLSEEEIQKGFVRPVRDMYVHMAGACHGITKMGQQLAETYARDPKFYGFTYCIKCCKHRPVEEFMWYGTKEQVGS